MKTKKPSRNHARVSQPKTATTAKTQTQTTAPNGTPATPPTPPPHRPIGLDCYLSNEERSYCGALVSVRAKFNPGCDQVTIKAQSDDYRFAHAHLDHVATRAVLHSTRESLAILKRFQHWLGRETTFGRVRQFRVTSYETGRQSADVTVEPYPAGTIVELTVRGGSGWGRAFCLALSLTPLEAEALALDLERALQEMERFGEFDL